LTTKRAKEIKLSALIKERERLEAAGYGPKTPRVIKLRHMIQRLMRDLGQGDLFPA